jgi:hypothetical protein
MINASSDPLEGLNDLVNMGFSSEKARSALLMYRGDKTQAIDALCSDALGSSATTTTSTSTAMITTPSSSAAVAAHHPVIDLDNEIPGISEEDKMVAMVLEQSRTSGGAGAGPASSSSSGSASGSAMYNTRRAPGVPVGLENIGNNCYFNAIIQTYFHVPMIRRAVLVATIPDPARLQELPERDRQLAVFLVSLQALFALMLGSDRAAVNPRQVVDNLLGGGGWNARAQQDVTEFNMLFLDGLDKALRLCWRVKFGEQEGAPAFRSTVDRLIDGAVAQRMKWGATEGEESCTTQKFSQLILDAVPAEGGAAGSTSTSTSLYDCLSGFMQPAVIEGFEVPGAQGVKVAAEKTSWLAAVPQILTLQLQRVAYNRDTGQRSKVHTAVTFGEELCLDRFRDENRAAVTAVRAEVAHVRAALAETLGRLARFELDPTGTGPVSAGLKSTLGFLGDPGFEDVMAGPLGGDQAARLRLVSVLEALKGCVDSRVASLTAEAERLRGVIAGAYDAIAPRDRPMHLFAVFVHSGDADGGHYWLHLAAGPEGQWMAYNDSVVRTADLATVLKDGIGTTSSSSYSCSAYCLMYLTPSMFREATARSHSPEALREAEWAALPPMLRAMVDGDNALLAASIKTEADRAAREAVEREAERLARQVRDGAEQARAMTRRDVSFTRDPRLDGAGRAFLSFAEIPADPDLRNVVAWEMLWAERGVARDPASADPLVVALSERLRVDTTPLLPTFPDTLPQLFLAQFDEYRQRATFLLRVYMRALLGAVEGDFATAIVGVAYVAREHLDLDTRLSRDVSENRLRFERILRVGQAFQENLRTAAAGILSAVEARGVDPATLGPVAAGAAYALAHVHPKLHPTLVEVLDSTWWGPVWAARPSAGQLPVPTLEPLTPAISSRLSEDYEHATQAFLTAFADRFEFINQITAM